MASTTSVLKQGQCTISVLYPPGNKQNIHFLCRRDEAMLPACFVLYAATRSLSSWAIRMEPIPPADLSQGEIVPVTLALSRGDDRQSRNWPNHFNFFSRFEINMLSFLFGQEFSGLRLDAHCATSRFKFSLCGKYHASMPFYLII